MNRKKKKSFRILLCLLCMLLIPAIPVSAALDDTTKTQMEEEAARFLGTAYEMSDDELENMRTNGGFYEVFVRSWYEDREVVGAFKEIESTETDDSGSDQIILNSVVDFENYTSDVVIYFDAEEKTPVNYVMNIRYSMAEKMTQAFQNMMVGLIVVFAVLIFLMIIIFLFRLFAPKQKEVQTAAAPSAVLSNREPAVVSVQQAVPQTGGTEEEIAAVIAAAIAAASEEAPSANGYLVRSVRRNKKSVWKRV
ncbi:MAG: OadG family protein [Eubacterium sp.]|nr:OadG family protein [Eubacterium sp.]